MAGLRGRGTSSGRSLFILFRMLVDASQGRREIAKTAAFTTKEFRSMETIGQRLISLFSRPIRARAGLFGSLGISSAREGLRYLADKEIKKTNEGLKETKKVAAQTGTAVLGAVANLTSANAALRAIRGVEAAQEIQRVSKAYSDASFAIKTFQEVLLRTQQPETTTKKFGPQVASGRTLTDLLGQLGVTGNRPFGEKGFTLRTKDAEEGLAEFQIKFNEIDDAAKRAGLATRIYGQHTARMLPILEESRQKSKAITDAVKAYEQSILDVANLEKALVAHREALLDLSRRQEAALRAEEKAEKALAIAQSHKLAQQLEIDPKGTRAGLTDKETEEVLKKHKKLENSVKHYAQQSLEAENIAKAALDKSSRAADNAVAVRQTLAKAIKKESDTELIATNTKSALMQKQADLNKLLADSKVTYEALNQVIIGGFTDIEGITPSRPTEEFLKEETLKTAAKYTKEIKELEEATELLNKDWVDAAKNLEKVRDREVLATRAAEQAGVEADKRVKIAKTQETFLKRAEKQLEESALGQAQKIRAINVTDTQAQAEVLLAEAVTARTAADTASNIVTATKIGLTKAQTIALSESSFAYKLNAVQTQLLSSAFKDSTKEGGIKELIRNLKQLNALRGVPGATPGPALPKLDKTAISGIDDFIKKFFSFEDAAKRAAFAAASVGEEMAGPLVETLEKIGPAAAKAIAPVAGLGVSLTTLAGGFAFVVGAGLAFIAIMFLIAKKVAENDAVIGRLAERTGVAADTLSALDIAAKKADLGGIKAIQERIGSFNRILGQVNRGNLPEAKKLLQGFGVDIIKLKDTNTVLIQVIDAINKTADPTQRAIALQTLFADRTGKMGLAVQEVSGSMKDFKKELNETGKLLSVEGAARALEFNRQLSDLQETAASLGQRLGREVLPPFLMGLKAANTQIDGLGSLADLVFGGIAVQVQKMTNEIILFVAFAKTLAQRLTPGTIEFSAALEQNIKMILAQQATIKKSQEEIDTIREESLREEREARDARMEQIRADADEEKRLANEISSHYKRQVDLRNVTARDALEQEIEAKRAAATADIVAKQEEIRLEEQRTLDEKKGETEETRKAKIKKLYVEMRQIESNFQHEEADLRTAFILKQEEQLDQAADDAIQAARLIADKKIDILQEAAQTDVRVREQNLNRIKVLEDEITRLELAEMDRRIKNSGLDDNLRRQLTAERTARMLKDEIDTQRRLRDIRKAALDAREADIRVSYARLNTAQVINDAKIAELQDAAERRNVTVKNRPSTIKLVLEANAAEQAAREMEVEVMTLHKATLPTIQLLPQLAEAWAKMRETAERAREAQAMEEFPITVSQAEREILKIQVDALNKRIEIRKQDKDVMLSKKQDVREINQEISAMEAGRVALMQEGARRVRAALIQEKEDTRNILAETNQIFRNARQVQIETQISDIQRQAQFYNISMRTRLEGIRTETKLNKENAEINHQATLQDIQDQKDALLDSAVTADEFWDRMKALNAAKEAEMRRHVDAMADIILQGKIKEREAFKANDAFEQGLSGVNPFAKYSEAAEKNLLKTGQSAMKMGDVGKMGLNVLGAATAQVAEATGSLVENWVIMGTTGPAAMRKMTATILASLAKQATVEAIMELARGFAALARAFFGDPKAGAEAAMHFKSAALFGAVAAVAAVGGRAVAGDLFAEKSKEATTKDAEKEKEEIEKKNEGRKQFVEHIHRVVVTGEKGFVARQFTEEVKNNNPEVRRAINTAAK